MNRSSGKFVSIASDDTWSVVQALLRRGHRAKDIALVYRRQGITTSAIYTKNSRHWNIPLVKGASRGIKCKTCREPMPNYRGGDCRDCYNKARRTEGGLVSGENHWNWKGGSTKSVIRFTPEYKKWRKAVFERDNYTCVKCGDKGVYIEADHIKPQYLFPELTLNINNGRTLCKPCHINTPTYGFKVMSLKRDGLLFI